MAETKITEKELKEGVEVECGAYKGEIVTIAYDRNKDRYVLKKVKNGEIIYSYTRLEQLVENTNRIFKLNDCAVNG
jgi:hypothetical protein